MPANVINSPVIYIIDKASSSVVVFELATVLSFITTSVNIRIHIYRERDRKTTRNIIMAACQRNQIYDSLQEHGVTLLSAITDWHELEGNGEAWKRNPWWLANGTFLDTTNIVFYLPDMYQELHMLTGETFDYARATCGTVLLYMVGTYDDGPLPFGPFWNEAWDSNMQISPKLVFGRKIDQSVTIGNIWKYKQALADATINANIHRQLVKLVGEEHSIDMRDHGIKKHVLLT